MDNLARHNALLDLERRYNGPIPPWERRAAIRASHTERENLEFDLGLARHCLQNRSDRLREFGREVMHRHRTVREARLDGKSGVWFSAKRHWREGRHDLQLYLDAFKAQRELVRRLEIRLVRMREAT